MMEIIRVEDSDLQEIEANHRRIQAISQPLSAAVILNDIKNNQRQRVIVICNTVSQAQGLFRDLQLLAEGSELNLTLLHSRFLPEDRAEKEIFLKEKFAQNWRDTADGNCYVLIATQVIEAGINITCEIMHTQLCPMNSLLQRAGRCARFPKEQGEVWVYYSVEVNQNNSSLATADFEAELEEQSNKPSFLPYRAEICKSTWLVLQQHTASSQVNQHVGFRLEETWINQVHQAEDILQAQRRQNNKMNFEQRFADAVFKGDRSAAGELIRNVDSRSLFVWEEPTLIDLDTPAIDPNKLQAFSVPISTLCKVWRDVQNLGYEIDWVFRRIEAPDGTAETYSLPNWEEIRTRQDLVNSIIILVNPKYVYYDKEIGLLIDINLEAGNNFVSSEKPQKPGNDEYKYRMDTYIGHLNYIWTCWCKPFSSKRKHNGELVGVTYASGREELLLAGGRLIKARIFPSATATDAQVLFEYLVFFAVLIHDLGKLQLKWQEVMRGWQAIAYSSFGGENPRSHLLAHTDSDPSNISQQKALRDYERQHRRPSHAVESAFIGRDILNQSLVPLLRDYFDADNEQIGYILSTVVMAAGRHHSAWAKANHLPTTIKLHPQAQTVVSQSWNCLTRPQFFPQHPPLAKSNLRKLEYPIKSNFDLDRFEKDQVEYLHLYLLVVRALRVCDQRSVQLRFPDFSGKF